LSKKEPRVLIKKLSVPDFNSGITASTEDFTAIYGLIIITTELRYADPQP